MTILHGVNTQNVLMENYTVLAARVLVTYMSGFFGFRKVVPKHIKHEFTEEISKKSEVVSTRYLIYAIRISLFLVYIIFEKAIQPSVLKLST